VVRGEELCVNYINLYQSRNARRLELWVSKKFLCSCCRCDLLPNCEEELRKFQADQLLEGVLCVSKDKKGRPSGCKGSLSFSLARALAANAQSYSSCPF
jgi:hypothetical protein